MNLLLAPSRAFEQFRNFLAFLKVCKALFNYVKKKIVLKLISKPMYVMMINDALDEHVIRKSKI